MNEKSEKNIGERRQFPEAPDPIKERRHTRTWTGSVFLLIALAILWRAESQWMLFAGFLLAGMGVFLMRSALFICFVLVGLAVLNAFVFGAEWEVAAFSFLAGGIATALFSIWTPDFRKIKMAIIRFIMNRLPFDSEVKQFIYILGEEFLAMMGFVLLVFLVLGWLGFIEELLIITIMAFLAWCAKMENYYGYKLGGLIFQNDEGVPSDFAMTMSPVYSLSAFHPGEKNNPTIGIHIAYRRDTFHTYFRIWCHNCPSQSSGPGKIYKLTQMSRMVQDVEAIKDEDMKCRNTNECWIIDWAPWNFNHKDNALLTNASMPIGNLSREAFMALVHIYFWFFVRNRYAFLGGIITFLGKNAGKIMYMFLESDADARKTTYRADSSSRKWKKGGVRKSQQNQRHGDDEATKREA